jgi:hypothetical protein
MRDREREIEGGREIGRERIRWIRELVTQGRLILHGSTPARPQLLDP